MDNDHHHPTGEDPTPMGFRLLAVPEPLWPALTTWLHELGFLVGTHADLTDEQGRSTYIVSPTDARIASATDRADLAERHRPPELFDRDPSGHPTPLPSPLLAARYGPAGDHRPPPAGGRA